MHKTLSNPPNPWSSTQIEYDLGEPPEVELTVIEEEAKSILSENKSPDIPFRYSLNPYRGCSHACAYCYARPSHQYLGFGAGTDFDSKIVVKVNAVELLEKRMRSRTWVAEPISFSGNTDPYQPLEASYQLTRRCLEVCLRHRNPAAIITKGSLVRRDVDLLAALEVAAGARVFVSVPFADDDVGHAIEPGASIPSQRFKTIRALAEAGVPVGVAIAPVIPGLNDSAIPEILERAAEAGARRAFMILLRLADEVEPVFVERLRASMPLRAEKVLRGLGEMRGGRVGDKRFGHRMVGQGPRWEVVRQVFHVHCRRLGLEAGEEMPTRLERPDGPLAVVGQEVGRAQLSLFGEE